MGITVYTQGNRNQEFERQVLIMQGRPGREAEAASDIRDLDHRALSDSSRPTVTSKTSTFVHNGAIWKAVIILI